MHWKGESRLAEEPLRSRPSHERQGFSTCTLFAATVFPDSLVLALVVTGVTTTSTWYGALSGLYTLLQLGAAIYFFRGAWSVRHIHYYHQTGLSDEDEQLRRNMCASTPQIARDALLPHVHCSCAGSGGSQYPGSA